MERKKTILGLTRDQDAAVERRDKLYTEANNACKEAKKRAEEQYKEAKKTAVDKQAKIQAEEAYKEALKQADKVRAAIVDVAHRRYLAVVDQENKLGSISPIVDEAVRRRIETIDQAYNAYEKAEKPAAEALEKAKKTAVDKQAKIQAEEAYKEAVKQAEKVHGAIVDEALEAFRVVWEQAGKDRQSGIEVQKQADEALKEAKKEAKKHPVDK